MTKAAGPPHQYARGALTSAPAPRSAPPRARGTAPPPRAPLRVAPPCSARERGAPVTVPVTDRGTAAPPGAFCTGCCRFWLLGFFSIPFPLFLLPPPFFLISRCAGAGGSVGYRGVPRGAEHPSRTQPLPGRRRRFPTAARLPSPREGGGQLRGPRLLSPSCGSVGGWQRERKAKIKKRTKSPQVSPKGSPVPTGARAHVLCRGPRTPVRASAASPLSKAAVCVIPPASLANGANYTPLDPHFYCSPQEKRFRARGSCRFGCRSQPRGAGCGVPPPGQPSTGCRCRPLRTPPLLRPAAGSGSVQTRLCGNRRFSRPKHRTGALGTALSWWSPLHGTITAVRTRASPRLLYSGLSWTRCGARVEF